MKFLHRSTYVALGLAAVCATAGSAAAAATLTPSVVTPASDLRGLRDLGKLGASTTVGLIVGLRLHDEAGLDALIAAQSTPGSPFYRHFLQPGQVRDAFGASRSDYTKTIATLRRAGFTVGRLDPMRTIVNASAPAATVEKYFATNLHAVATGPRTTSYANVTPAVVPAELQATVAAVTGFKATPLYATAAATARAARKNGSGRSGIGRAPGPAATAAPTPPPGPPPLYAPDGGYGPQLTASAFDAPIRHGFFGNGVAVADLIDGVIDDTADIAPYLNEFNVKRTGPPTTTVAVAGGCNSGLFGCFDSFSAVVDAQGILGVAPGAAYFVYELPSLGTAGIVDGIHTVVNDNRADVVNIAFAGCETAVGELSFLEDQGFKLGSAQGITFVVTTFGGSNPCFTSNLSVQSPGNSPNVLTVGGADTFADQFGNVTNPPIANAGSGGGVSVLFPKPSFQKGIAGTKAGGRNLPDVAGPAAINSFGPAVYYAPFGFPGMPWVGGFPFVNVAPFTGAVAGIAQISGSRLGVLDTSLYPLFKKNGYKGNVFRDVTLGCNSIFGGASGPWCSAPGFDLVTGIGVPSAYKVAKKL